MKLLYSLLLIVCLQGFAAEPPENRRTARAEYISQFLKPGDVGVEIGVYNGVFAYHVLLKNNPSQLYLIDPWVYFPDEDDDEAKILKSQEARDRQYERVCSYFEPFDHVDVIRMRSEDVAYLFDDNSLDYVYIDGEHSYDAVTRDLENYFPKVKAGGYILGDDLHWKGIGFALTHFLERHKGECELVNPRGRGGNAGQFAVRKTGRFNFYNWSGMIKGHR